MRGRPRAGTAPRDRVNHHTRFAPRPDPACGNCDGRGCMSCVFREVHDRCEDDCPTCCAADDGWTVSRSGRDINDGPVYAPDGSYACGDPDCYGCWPEGHPNTVAWSAGAVCYPTAHDAIAADDRELDGPARSCVVTRVRWMP